MILPFLYIRVTLESYNNLRTSSKLVPSKWVEIRESTRITMDLSRIGLEKNTKILMRGNFDPSHTS